MMRLPRPLRVLDACLALSLLPAASLAAAPPRIRPPDVAPAPAPLAAPELVTGSPMVAAAPPALEAPPTAAIAAQAAPVRTDRLRLAGLMDRDVIGIDKFDIGHVIDVLVDPNGQPRAVLVETGGFLGIGNRRIAVAWTSLSFPGNRPDGPIRTNMTIEQVRSAPAYVESGPVSVAEGAAFPVRIEPAPAVAAPLPLPPVADAPRHDAVPVAEPPPPLPQQHTPAQKLAQRTRTR